MEGNITSITRQKKNKSRASIAIEGEYAFPVNEQTIEEFRLRKGDYIEQSQYDEIVKFDSYITAKRVALKYLNHRARSEKEIRDRLTREEIPLVTIERVLEFLRSYKMVDDEAWARAFTNDMLARKPIGVSKLKRELHQHGIAAEVAESITVAAGPDFERARAAAEKRWERLMRTESIPAKRRQKLTSFLALRGFSFDIIDEVWKSLASREEIQVMSERIEA